METPSAPEDAADLEELFRQEAEGITERLDLLLESGTQEAGAEALRLAHTLKGLAVATQRNSLRDLARNLETSLARLENDDSDQQSSLRQAVDAARGLITGEPGAASVARDASTRLVRRTRAKRRPLPWARRALVRRLRVDVPVMTERVRAALLALEHGYDAFRPRLELARSLEVFGAALGLLGARSESSVCLELASYLSLRAPQSAALEAANQLAGQLEDLEGEVDGGLAPGVLRTVETVRASINRRRDEERTGQRFELPWPDADDPGALLRAIDSQSHGMAILDARPRKATCFGFVGELGLAPHRRKRREEEGFVKVPRRRLDRLLGLAERLVAAKANSRALARLARRIAESAPAGYGLHRMVRQAEQHDRQLDRLARSTQEAVLRARLVSVRGLFSLVRLTVQEFLGRHPEKHVELELSGDGTELDKGTLDALVEPVLHLVRNALEHGIEPRDERVALGKPSVSRLYVSAHSGSGGVVVEVRDDGRGLEPSAFGDESDLVLLADERVRGGALAFAGGVTTTTDVSDDAGRGLGLVAVLERIRGMRGRLHFETTPNEGTRARIEVPPAAATSRVLLVRCSQEVFALPLRGVSAVTEVNAEESQERRRVRLEQLVGRARAQDRRRARAPAQRERRKRDRFAVRVRPMLRRGEHEEMLELIVDDVLRRDLVVVRPLGRRFTMPGINGAALLGDGRLVLVLDPWRLLLARESPSSGRLRLPSAEELK